MPGILPMKMIRVGQNSQSRIAQACDRCRSKKIRCDGIRPCCSQCANVGFECKTSDKLSRRAFPRGYTESLEDRVRALEAEVRDLKALLDEKDEKIDMLSRIHNFSPQPRKSSLSPSNTLQIKSETESPQGDVILVEIPAPVQTSMSSTGTSTTTALVEAFEEKVHGTGRSCPSISSTALLQTSYCAVKASDATNPNRISPAPPRVLSDQYINLYFQEWQPLLPVLHRPTFLRLYEQYINDPEAKALQNNRHGVAQLFLIFEIAAHSSSSKARPNTAIYESQWRRALSSVSSTPTVATIQCHILAQVVYLLKADYPHLLRYRAYSVSMIHQLSFHQGHKCHSLPCFDAETSKKLFWCQYVLDKFASAATGSPQMLRESDITTEFPANIDDEKISTHGFSPSLPGELTKISSALALFRISKILGRTLEHLYPSRASYQLSLNKLHSLSDELDQWQEELPDHLRLRFCNDKPATNLISCRSPLLSLAYFYTRSLIHRPLLYYGSGSAVSAATIVLAAAAKHQLQILDLLDERSMNFTFPLSKQDILISAGFSILWQSLDLDDDSKLIKDNRRSLALQQLKLTKENHVSATEFQKIAAAFIQVQKSQISSTNIEIDNSAARMLNSMPAPHDKGCKSARKHLQAIATRLSSLNGRYKSDEVSRRNTFSQPGPPQSMTPNLRTSSTVSLSSTRSAPAPSLPVLLTNSPSHDRSPDNSNNDNGNDDDNDDDNENNDRSNSSNNNNNNKNNNNNNSSSGLTAINLDYLPFADEPYLTLNRSAISMLPPKKSPHPSHIHPGWEQYTNNVDPTTSDIFNTVSPTMLNQSTVVSGPSTDWSNDMWQVPTFDLTSKIDVPQSLLSFSEESLTSADELVFSAPPSHKGSTATSDGLDNIGNIVTTEKSFKGIAIPIDDDFDFQDVPE